MTISTAFPADAPHPEPDWGTLRPSAPAKACIRALRNGSLPGDVRRFLEKALMWCGPVYDIELGGLKFRCRVGDNLTEAKAVTHPWHLDVELGHILDRLAPGDTFVDVGANCGIFTTFAARAVGRFGTVLAIEPNPIVAGRLAFNTALNSLTNIQLVESAVGESGGRMDLFILPHQLGRASMHREALSGRRDGIPKSLSVAVNSLQELLESHRIERIAALKIDIEGYEDRALLPFFAAAQKERWPRAILMETKHSSLWQADCYGQLLELGYQCTWRSPHDALLELARSA